MNVYRKLQLLLATMLVAISVHAQNKWELKKNSDGVRIYTKSVASSNIKALKVEFEANGTVKQLAALLNDISKQKDWVYSTKSSALIKRINNDEAIYYTEKTLPWPMTNRDVVIHTKMAVDTNAGTLGLNASSVANVAAPVKKGIVRVTFSQVVWKVSTINPNTIKIEYEAQADPGGAVPAWITNMFLTKGPHETFIKLKKLLASQT